MVHPKFFIRNKTVGLPVTILFFLSVTLGLVHWGWVQLYFVNAEGAAKFFAKKIAKRMEDNQMIDDALYREFILIEPRVGYVVAANYRTGYRHGITNPTLLKFGSKELEMFIIEQGNSATLSRLIQPGGGFPGEYLHVISVIFVPPKNFNDQTPIGVLKVGYVIPGFFRGMLPFGRGFFKLIVGWWILSSVVAIGILVREISALKRKKPLVIEPVEKIVTLKASTVVDSHRDDLDWLEEELEFEDTIRIDQDGRVWKSLFNGKDFEGWNVKGSWYISDGELVGPPWAATLISKSAPKEEEYVFQVFAKKVSGPDGFIVLFPCNGHYLLWVLGGWGNHRSELVGHLESAIPNQIERNRWYLVEVRVTAEWLEGYLDNEEMWKIPRSKIDKSFPEVGLPQGLGIGVWNTLAKFRDIRLSTT